LAQPRASLPASNIQVDAGNSNGGKLRSAEEVRPIVELLRQGVKPQKMALGIALGAASGVFRVRGSTTAPCALAVRQEPRAVEAA
jgi:hypothetical protein